MLFSQTSPAPTALASAVFALAIAAGVADAQQLTQPVFRVANAAQEQPVTAPQDTTRLDEQVVPAAATADVPFDLVQRPGEHPLMPCLRLATSALGDIDRQIQDYSAIFTKVERINGTLGDPQRLELRVRHEPFSVYMRFISPNPGQEALYVANQNNGKLVAMGAGWKRRVGKLNLDPTGAMAMSGQKYPITKAGIRNLTAELIEKAEADVKYAECTVKHGPSRVDGRPATMIEAVHPVPRKNFEFHKAQIFIDNELRVPVAYRAYSWPTTEGGPPVLEEQYIYTNLKLNNGFTEADFSPENPAYFQ